MIKKLKKGLLFSLAMLPFAALGGYFTILYAMSGYEPAYQQETIADIGSYDLLILASTLRAAVIAFICSFFGYILSDKVGLMRPFRFEGKPLLLTFIASLLSGIVFGLDYWLFGGAMPYVTQIHESQLSTTPEAFAAGILYGGIVEEVMLRLLFMSLVALLIWKIFARKYDREHIPMGVFVAANILAATLFAIGHLPATISTFSVLTPPRSFSLLSVQRRTGACIWLAVSSKRNPVCHDCTCNGAYRVKTDLDVIYIRKACAAQLEVSPMSVQLSDRAFIADSY